jgi:hypothetical protein
VVSNPRNPKRKRFHRVKVKPSPYVRLETELTNAREALTNAVDKYVEMHRAVENVLAMLDASSFGGHKTYRCLTAFEVSRLEEIRKLVKP